MIKNALVFIALIQLGSLGCTRQDEASREVTAYLEEKFHLTPNDSTMYCFFPANQCRNCFRYDAAFVSPQVNAHTVIITGFDTSNFKGFSTVLCDVNDDMLELQALDYGNRIFTFAKGNIKNNLAVDNLYAQLIVLWNQN